MSDQIEVIRVGSVIVLVFGKVGPLEEFRFYKVKERVKSENKNEWGEGHFRLHLGA